MNRLIAWARRRLGRPQRRSAPAPPNDAVTSPPLGVNGITMLHELARWDLRSFDDPAELPWGELFATHLNRVSVGEALLDRTTWPTCSRLWERHGRFAAYSIALLPNASYLVVLGPTRPQPYRLFWEIDSLDDALDWVNRTDALR
jgi:hypothetical protein